MSLPEKLRLLRILRANDPLLRFMMSHGIGKLVLGQHSSTPPCGKYTAHDVCFD